jgi:hypothetical protein
MSREERRAYRRMMKNADPLAPPAPRGAAARQAERVARRRAARAASGRVDARLLAPRFVGTTLAIAAVVGLIAFSLQWPNMPFALYVGIGVGVLVILVAIGVRLMLARAGPPTRQ